MDKKIFLEFKDENNKVKRVIRWDAIEAIEIHPKDKKLILIYTSNHIFAHSMENEQLAEAELICLKEGLELFYKGIY